MQLSPTQPLVHGLPLGVGQRTGKKVKLRLSGIIWMKLMGVPLKHMQKSCGLPVVAHLQVTYSKLASVSVRIIAESKGPSKNLFICSEMPTVSSPALMKGHQPLTRFCWNMEILFSSLIATAMPRSQLLAVFAALWKPFRFSSRVPGERSDVTVPRDQKDTKAFKQQFLGKTHGAMQHFGPSFIAKHLPVPSAIHLYSLALLHSSP